MAMRAITLTSMKTIESEQDEAKDTAEATKFTIGAIDAFVSAFINDRSLMFVESATADSAIAQVKIGEANLDTVRFGLRDWHNFKAGADDLKFQTVEKVVMGKVYTVASDDCLAVMGQELIRELAVAIRAINDVAETGKTGTAQPSP